MGSEPTYERLSDNLVVRYNELNKRRHQHDDEYVPCVMTKIEYPGKKVKFRFTLGSAYAELEKAESAAVFKSARHESAEDAYEELGTKITDFLKAEEDCEKKEESLKRCSISRALRAIKDSK